MFKTFKILWLKIRREYHHCLVIYYDWKSDRRAARGYCNTLCIDKAWRHLHKELELNNKLHKLKGI